MKTIVFKIIPFFALLICLGSFWAGCGTANTAEEIQTHNMVAEVNGKAITKQDLENKIESLKSKNSFELNGKSYKQVPDQSTSEYILFQKDVAVALVNDEVISTEANKMGVSVSNLFDRVTASVPKTTDADVQAFYSANNFRTFHVRHIVVADLATAQEGAIVNSGV